jgi:8-oxo-dGTP pyrophosphatase MutT (NUDIX family)
MIGESPDVPPVSDQPPTRDRPVQAAAVPFCRREDGVYVCLLRRKDSRSWGLPKGFIDPGDTEQDTVLNEAWEEAGLRGQVVGEPLGTYQYQKFRGRLTVVVYLMEVREEEPTWLEQRVRERRWYPLQQAVDLLATHPARHLLPRAAARLLT